MEWEDVKLGDIMKPDPERDRRWQEWLKQKRQSEIQAQQEFRKVLVDSNNAPYARHP